MTTKIAEMSSEFDIPLQVLEFKWKQNLQKETEDCYQKVVAILNVLMNDKLNDNFYAIVHRCEPMTDKQMSDHMTAFNHDEDIAIKDNDELKIIIDLWIQDSTKLRAESQKELQNVTKCEEFLKLLDKQEKDYTFAINKVLKGDPLHSDDHQSHAIQTNGLVSASSPPLPDITAVSPPSDANKKVAENTSEVKSELIITLKVDENTKDYSLPEAIALISEKKNTFAMHFFAADCLEYSVRALQALNHHKRTHIQKWCHSHRLTNNPKQHSLEKQSITTPKP